MDALMNFFTKHPSPRAQFYGTWARSYEREEPTSNRPSQSRPRRLTKTTPPTTPTIAPSNAEKNSFQATILLCQRHTDLKDPRFAASCQDCVFTDLRSVEGTLDAHPSYTEERANQNTPPPSYDAVVAHRRQPHRPVQYSPRVSHPRSVLSRVDNSATAARLF